MCVAVSGRNVDEKTVLGFGEEWSRFDQSRLEETELFRTFEQYFRLFPWGSLPADAIGVDIGCGSGRWARFVAPRVGTLICVDPSAKALDAARRNLRGFSNVSFVPASVDQVPIEAATMDFCFSLGVLHHIPDTRASIAACARLLKPGAPFLLYLYYAFDNRPAWYRSLWRISDHGRRFVCRLLAWAKTALCEAIPLGIYLPAARTASLLERAGFDSRNMPLTFYRDKSFYTIRTDALGRFGTRLENRFNREQIRSMMESAGLREVSTSGPPYWCAIGYENWRKVLPSFSR